MADLSTLTFKHSAYFLLFLPLLIWFIKTPKTLRPLPSLLRPISLFFPLLAHLPSTKLASLNTQKSSFDKWLFSLLISLMIISLAQPISKTPILQKAFMPQAIDLILVVNSSVSMVLKDYKQGDKIISRMQMAKLTLLKLVQQFKGARMGLVLLGNPSAIWLPLTSDKAQLRFAIEKIKPALAGRSADVGAALDLVRQQFIPDKQRKTAVLLVDDAYLQLGSSSPINAVNRLNQAGFTLHTLAIGSSKKPDFSLGIGHLIYAPVDLTLLQQLARAGKGTMIRVNNNQASNQLLNLLSTQQFIEPPTSGQIKQVEWFQYPLFLALLILLLQLFPVHSLFYKTHHVD